MVKYKRAWEKRSRRAGAAESRGNCIAAIDKKRVLRATSEKLNESRQPRETNAAFGVAVTRDENNLRE